MNVMLDNLLNPVVSPQTESRFFGSKKSSSSRSPSPTNAEDSLLLPESTYIDTQILTEAEEIKEKEKEKETEAEEIKETEAEKEKTKSSKVKTSPRYFLAYCCYFICCRKKESNIIDFTTLQSPESLPKTLPTLRSGS